MVRSYKIRGAFNMMSSLPEHQLKKGVVCASAGNHAQGFAYSCNKLGVRGVVFMPVITPQQKVQQTRLFGNGYINIQLTGDTFDDCAAAAQQFAEDQGFTFIPPFDDIKIIEGQSTVGIEILEALPEVDYLFLPIGGGGLCAGVGSYFRLFSPKTTIVGAEPEGAASMQAALKAGHPITLKNIDAFVDGAAVKRIGNITFPICRQVLDALQTVAEGHVCAAILDLYNKDALVVEPAGALAIAALDYFEKSIAGKNVVCIVSGGNNDIERMQEIKERSLQYLQLKHYFLINFAQRAGALKSFVNNVLGPTDDITRFEYMKKHNKETGPALVGIQLQCKSHYNRLIENMEQHQVQYRTLNKDDDLFGYLV